MCPPVRSTDGVVLISEFVEAVEAVIQEKQGALAWAAEHKPSVPGCTEAAKAAIAAQAAVDRGVEEAQQARARGHVGTRNLDTWPGYHMYPFHAPPL